MIKIRAPYKMTTYCKTCVITLARGFLFLFILLFVSLCVFLHAFLFSLYCWHRKQKVLTQKYLLYSSSWLHFISFHFICVLLNLFFLSIARTDHIRGLNVYSHAVWPISMKNWSWSKFGIKLISIFLSAASFLGRYKRCQFNSTDIM